MGWRVDDTQGWADNQLPGVGGPRPMNFRLMSLLVCTFYADNRKYKNSWSDSSNLHLRFVYLPAFHAQQTIASRWIFHFKCKSNSRYELSWWYSFSQETMLFSSWYTHFFIESLLTSIRFCREPDLDQDKKLRASFDHPQSADVRWYREMIIAPIISSRTGNSSRAGANIRFSTSWCPTFSGPSPSADR